MLISPLLLAAALTSPSQATDSQTLRYTLAVDGKAIGHRELELKYLQTELGNEVRILETWTELELTVGGLGYRYQQRLSGRGDTGGFASVMVDGGVSRDVQATPVPTGWVVTIGEGEEAKVYNLAPSEFDLTSLGLLDPSAPEVLEGLTELTVLTAETGATLSGPLTARGEVLVAIDGQSIAAREWLWSLPEGEVRMAYDADGVLLRYTMRVAGRAVTATLDEAPEGRSWGSAMEAPVIQMGGGEMEETEL